MKKILMTASVVVALAACQKAEEDKVVETRPEVEATSWKLTVPAQKEEITKGLSLEGKSLATLWKEGESVHVYKDGSYLSGLDVIPESTDAKFASISGTITVSGIALDDELTLLFPRKDWDYRGQKGVLLSEEGSIEKKYDYALATVNVNSITPGEGEEGSIATSKATFENQQNIYRLSFKVGNAPLAVKSLTLTSSREKLVVSKVIGGDTTYGAISVNMATTSEDLADGLICVAVRNEDTSEQDYHFSLGDADRKAYLATKHIPADAFTHGFLGIKNVAATPLQLPIDAVNLTDVAL